MKKEYWLFNLLVGCITAVLFGGGNLLISFAMMAWIFGCACLFTWILFDSESGKITKKQVFFSVAFLASFIAAVTSAISYKLWLIVVMFFISIIICFAIGRVFAYLFGNEVIPEKVSSKKP